MCNSAHNWESLMRSFNRVREFSDLEEDNDFSCEMLGLLNLALLCCDGGLGFVTMLQQCGQLWG